MAVYGAASSGSVDIPVFDASIEVFAVLRLLCIAVFAATTISILSFVFPKFIYVPTRAAVPPSKRMIVPKIKKPMRHIFMSGLHLYRVILPPHLPQHLHTQKPIIYRKVRIPKYSNR